MKSIKNIYQAVCLTGLLALGTSSCTDWLTIYPQDRVVEENFWEDKNDLEGVRNAAYRQMARTVSKFAIWGDLRSDSYVENPAIQNDITTHNRYIEIISGEPDSSMAEFDWKDVYTTINYCNKVLQHGEEVLARDKQFTSTEWNYIRAEMTALRSLNYFYLIRAFKDVPFTKKVVNSDAEVEAFPLTNQLTILDSIILDCQRVEGQARNRFSDRRDSKGMITNSAIYAMLADMHLWRASLHEGRHDKSVPDKTVDVHGDSVSYTIDDDYRKAIDYAELSRERLAQQTLEEGRSSGLSMSRTETFDYSLSNGGILNCNMIKNDFEGASQSIVPQLEAQRAIFDSKNSQESIFELQYSVSDNLGNDIVNSLYGYGNSVHLAVSHNDAFGQLYNGGITGEGDDGGMWDSRLWVGCQNKLQSSGTSSSSSAQAQSNYYCMKYHSPELVMEGTNTSREIKALEYTSYGYNNWIIYRMTDVMLIEAEAYACLAGTSKTKQEYKNAKAICNAIHRRSFCNYRNSTKVPNTDAFTDGTIGNTYLGTRKNTTGKTIGEGIQLVMNERQIELLGEGKRWFDLVRFAERCSYTKNDPADPREEGVTNGYTGMVTMIEMYLGSGSNASFATTLKNRFKNRYGLYCPIYEMEVKASNGAIEQNPVWNKSKYER